MGLDIYLHHYTDFKKSKAIEAKYEKGSEAIWDKIKGTRTYEQLTQEEKDNASSLTAKLAEKLGLAQYGEDKTYKTDVRHDSKLHPGHLFEVGYFRSSYNDSGINRVLEKMGLPTLYDMFPHDEKDYEFSPNWKESLKLVNKALVGFNHAVNGFNGQFDCFDIAATNLFTGPSPVKNDATALKIFQKEVENTDRAFPNYSNRQGHFFNEPLTVRGFIPGIDPLGQPCLYIITEREKNEKGENEGLKSYRESLEVVRETIEFVLAQKDPQNYYLAWSG